MAANKGELAEEEGVESREGEKGEGEREGWVTKGGGEWRGEKAVVVPCT